MIPNLIEATLNIVKLFWSRSSLNSKKLEPQKDSIPEVAKDENKKDKILFQPNVLIVKEHSDFPSDRNPSVSNKETNISDSRIIHKITLECGDAAMLHLENLCRYFEINQFEALARGIWLLTVVRDVEINNKKLGVVSVDSNGLVIDVVPVNIV